MGVVSNTLSWPKSQLHTILQIKESDSPVFKFFTNNSLCRQTNQRFICTGSLHAFQTSSRGASNMRVMTSSFSFAELFFATMFLLPFY